MREIEKRRSKTIAAKTPEEFDKLYNSTADELGQYEPEVDEFQMDGKLYARFIYVERTKIRENLEDDFMQENVRCHCSDCPFIEIGTDARRRWFPCPYSSTGETRVDSPACAIFYQEAVKRMREACNR